MSGDSNIRIAVVVPVWRQGGYLAGAVRSALGQEIDIGVGVVIVNDGCPDPETHRVGEAMRDADPGRVSYLRQPNLGVSAARNAGILAALERWPNVEAVFPLDADNLLSPLTIAKLTSVLEERPDAAWASPTLEFFGAESGEWQIPGPYLPYRQLYGNQSDTGSLIRRSIFDAGIGFDEEIGGGYEDWDLFLRATMAGFRGALAGRCGFRYRRRPRPEPTEAEERALRMQAELRARHPDLFEPVALSLREHREMPRFALVRGDRDDVLLTSRCDLEPRRLSLAEFVGALSAAGGPEPSLTDHVPAITVFAESATIDRLEGERLAAALTRVQREMRGRGVVELRAAAPDAHPVGLAVRGAALGRLAGGADPAPEAAVEIETAAAGPPPARALAAIGAAVGGDGFPLRPESHSAFFEYHHIEGTDRPLAMCFPRRHALHGAQSRG